MSKQPIIVFEGIEGSGKTYHINNIEKLLIKTKTRNEVSKTRHHLGSIQATEAAELSGLAKTLNVIINKTAKI